MKKLLLFFSFFNYFLFCSGQLLTWDFNGNTGSELTVNGVPQDEGISSGIISRGNGIVASGNSGRFNANTWTQPNEASAIANNDYFEFTITMKSTYSMTLTSIDFNYQRSSTGPQNFSLRSSIDGFASTITTFSGLGESDSGTASLGAAFTNLTETVIFRLYGYGNTNTAGSGGFEGTGDDLVINGATALPVELAYFKGKKDQNTYNLTWQTLTEQNNAHFDIQRSNNSKTWNTIDKVAGAGTTDEVQNYDYTDKNPLAGMNYYRLKQVDYDGAFDYSPILSVDMGKEAQVSVYPNPVAAEVTFEFPTEQRKGTVLSVYHVNGELVREMTLEADALKVDLAVDDLVSGIYWVRVIHDKTEMTSRFVKQ